MLELLNGYNGNLIINNKEYSSVEEAEKAFDGYKGGCTIVINPTVNKLKTVAKNTTVESKDSHVYMIKVRRYMTNYDNTFFLSKLNESPMPYMYMVGRVLQETNKLVKMECRADMVVPKTTVCMRCGRPLSNPISQYLGIGPECGAREHLAYIENGGSIAQAQESMRKELQNIKWTGWIIKSAIESQEKLDNYEW